MAVKPIPDGYNTVIPYLVATDVAKLMEFVKRVFGAVENERMVMPDRTIMHAEIKIGNSVIMIGTAPPGAAQMPCMLYVFTENVDVTYKRALGREQLR